MTSRVVYSAIFGRYEKFDRSTDANSACRKVLFTDSTELGANVDGWEVVTVQPPVPDDPIRSARMIKILGHPVVWEHEESLWIDNRVSITTDHQLLFDQHLRVQDVAVPIHSYRGAVAEEFQAVLRGGFDDPRVVRRQMRSYTDFSPAALAAQTLWTAILFRRHTPRVRHFNHLWAGHVLAYSRRDQLSIRWALECGGIEFTGIKIDNSRSEWHTWRTFAEVSRGQAPPVKKTTEYGRYLARERFVDGVYRAKNRFRSR